MTDQWWQSAPLAPASDPSFSGFIPGSPKPPKEPSTTWATLSREQATAAGLDPSFTWQRSSAGETKKVGDAGDPQKDSLGEAVKGLGVDELVANVKKARGAIDGGYATGMTGAVLSRIPGTSAADFRGYIDAIQGGIILEKMQALKDASKTGASGLGALSEKEGERLAASVASIKPNMSDKALKDSLNAIEQHANFLRAVQDGKDPRDPNVAKQYGMGVVPAAAAPPASGGGGTTPPGVADLSDDQKQAYAAFLAVNPKPDGPTLKTFLEKLTGKTVANADDIAKKLAAGGGYNTTTQDLSYDEKLRQQIDKEDKLGISDDAITRLAKQGSSLSLSDEAAGVGKAAANALTSPLTGNFDPIFAYKFGRDQERMQIDDARKQLGYGGSAIEFVAGMGAGGPSAALEALAPKAAAKMAGRAGAVGGALSGFGSGEGVGDSATRAAVGALGGYALGRYAPAAVERVLPRRFRTPQGMAPEVADAAEAEGVDLIRPMVDPRSISEYGALESNVYSQPTIRGAAGRVRGQIEDRVQALGSGGNALEPNAAGDVVQNAGNRFITRSRGIKNRMYDRAESLGGGASVKTTDAQGQIDQEIAQLAEAPETNAGEITFLERLKSDLSQPQTVGSIRRIRTSLRGQINQHNLTATSAEARAMRVLDAAKNDIQRDAPPAAASAYARADAFNRERQIHIDTVLRDVLGKRDQPLDSEKAFSRLKSLASPGGGGRRLAAIMRNLEPDERQDIAASIAQSLGRRAPDEPFSTALFVSQTGKLSPAARRTIFGPDGAQSIDNLRLLSRKLEEAEKDINRSRSATVLERQGIRTAARAFISTLAGIGGTAATGSVSGGVAGVAVAGAAMGASAARRVLSARAMVNPRVSRWLAESADVSTPPQAKEAARKLSVIIAREPAVANELKPVYDFLENRLELPLAAQPDQSETDNEAR